MEIVVDNEEFCIRLYQNVAYLKVIGIQDKTGADFFEKTIDEVISKYSHDRFAALCDLTELILPHPSISRQINRAIVKLSDNLNFGHNAVIVEPKFLQIMQAYIFSFYLRNISAKTKIFKKESRAVEWLNELNYQLTEIEGFLSEKTT
ncbi:hypothetical protein L3049_09150 [Labilibaculum sp. DW002]|jgi:hypothetical protein|uniref:STAS/SEC14 domain-containing protein n=1 Tax=Paralabilibaculum antarcticum TaxID=2912572 RepID=A0ABT5VRX8_9BACT|nr:hypothetical protein [Labilibaculum sp. DW002]MDE5418175.1 hypothetical protein [Labilibaculum sp. DW002]